MASKITPQNLIDVQFVAEQFNTVANFTVFLQSIIDNQEAILAARLGDSVFNSATTEISNQVKRISLCLCAAELLQLRINRLAGNVDADSAVVIKVLQDARKEYLKEADDKLSRTISSGSSADSGGYAGSVQTSSSSDAEVVSLWPTQGVV